MLMADIRRYVAAGTMSMSLGAITAQAAELIVFSTISAKEALIELVPEFEHASGHKVNITYAGGSGPFQAHQRRHARRSFHWARRVFRSADQRRQPAGGQSYRVRTLRHRPCGTRGRTEAGHQLAGKIKERPARGRLGVVQRGRERHAFCQSDRQLGIEDVIAAKRVTPRAGELVGAVVARGDADIAVQQISELLPVAGIQILDPLPAELQQTIVYGATVFPQSTQRDVARAFVNFLRADAARAVLRKKGLDPA